MSELWPLFLLRPFPLPHECVRKVRSVQKSREVIYHLRMIAPCAVKAIRFNACIHAAPKSFAYFGLLSFFSLCTSRPTRCTCTTLISAIINVENSLRSVRDRFVPSTLCCDTSSRNLRVYAARLHATCIIVREFDPRFSRKLKNSTVI